MNRLNALQEQLQAVQANIQNLEQTRLLASEQLEILQNMQTSAAAAADAESGGEPAGPAAELAEARARLQELRARYTDAHPGVVRMEKRVQQLKEEMAEFEASSSPEAGQQRMAMAGSDSRESRIQDLTFQLKEIELDLQALRKESRNIRSQIRQYQEWIDAAPVREAEWADLTRDYEELREYHDELVSQSLAAEAAKSLEVRQKGSQFQVVDGAFLPRTPLKGTFLKILMMAVFGGLAVGAGLIVGRDFMDTSFKSAREIETTLSMSIACALPLIVTTPEQRRSRVINILWYAFFAAWFLAWTAAVFYFWQKGDIII
jgi:uncharacterized protein involved in exopolysaccharide biosynthesis